MMYARHPLSLRNVEDLLFERGIDICHETVRLWWNRFGLMFADEIRRKRVQQMRAHTDWRWRLDEVDTSSVETSTGKGAQPPRLSGGPSWAMARAGLGELRPTGDKLTLD
ncbi:hypothetical protein [Phenylobacterium sp.]|uniref:hypothetical protein n=1 Tax=Phenylobacterium sp. TaxID=1871053 RepID=UPI00271C4376|nr:hypothetical protein [Phenylobacterium sp.]MDO8802364.1 hypothetical protein [Phenylobacterium sp.]